MDSRTTHESTIEEDIRGLVEAFEQRSLPRALWTHQAHLLVALWYVMNYPEEEAIVRIREGIQAYNASLGNTSGYHETVTRAWISVIRSFLASRDGSRRVEKHASDLLERCGRPDYLLRFYSQDLLDSRQAREAWVAPDLAEIAPASV